MAEQRTYAILTAGIFAAQSFAFYLTERNRHKRLRWTGRALVGLRTEEHARLAACKSQIGSRGPARNCSAFQGLRSVKRGASPRTSFCLWVEAAVDT